MSLFKSNLIDLNLSIHRGQRRVGIEIVKNNFIIEADIELGLMEKSETLVLRLKDQNEFGHLNDVSNNWNSQSHQLDQTALVSWP